MANDETVVDQVRAATEAAAFCVRDDRGLIEVTGSDRAVWLSNLVTNVLTTLAPGEGNYAFATNRKGRVVFDMNMLVLEDRLWLDVDQRQLSGAMEHLERFHITEDVALTDITPAWRRMAVVGPAVQDTIDRLSLGNLVAMAQLQHRFGTIADVDIRLVRHDFVGPVTVEFFVPKRQAEAVQTAVVMCADGGSLPWIEAEALNGLRIEAGRPASVVDIDEQVVAPETCQIERGISYQKGCYLGQEVIERIRTHDALARMLVGIRLDGDAGIETPAVVRVENKDVGRITSACWSEALSGVLALGYVRTAHARPEVAVTVPTDDGERKGTIVALPVRR